MKKLLGSLASISLMSFSMSTVFAATINCAKPQPEPVTKSGKVYNFAMSVRCTVGGVQGNISELKEVYQTHINNSPRHRVHHSQAGVAYEGMGGYQGLRGYKLDVTESRQTRHGDMDVRENLYLVDNGRNIFILDGQSTSIKASGNAKYTQGSQQQITVTEQGSSQYELVATKKIQVEKKGLWPESIFKSQAMKGLEKDIVEMAQKNAERVASGFDQ